MSTQLSAFVWDASLPSIRPTARSTPRVTRCAKRCRRWSLAFAPCTSIPDAEYESAKSLLKNDSRSWCTYGTSAITTVRFPSRASSCLPVSTLSASANQSGRKT